MTHAYGHDHKNRDENGVCLQTQSEEIKQDHW